MLRQGAMDMLEASLGEGPEKSGRGLGLGGSVTAY